MKRAIFGFIVLLLVSKAFCAERLVPGQYPTIQSAIDAALPGDTVIVAPGTYTGDGNMNLSFRGKAITVRSIDPNNPSVVESTIIDCNRAVNSNGFIFQSDDVPGEVLDGLTITHAGKAGVYCSNSGPTIRNCNIVANKGGIYCDQVVGNAQVTIVNCRITDNAPGWSPFYGGGISCRTANAKIVGCAIRRNGTSFSGGGIYCRNSSWPYPRAAIVDCNISENIAQVNGGGLYAGDFVTVDNCRILNNQASYGGGINATSSLKVSKSIIVGNKAQNGGGAAYIESSSLQISDSIVSANFSQSDGGGLYAAKGSIIADRCTVAGNVASHLGGGVFGYGQFSNCILWGNSDVAGTGLTAQISPLERSTSVVLSCIQDENPNDTNIPFGGVYNNLLTGGEKNGNIDDDPMFIRMPNDGGDGWGVGNNDDYGDLHLLPNSPCIDAGSPLFRGKNITDIDGQPRVIGQALDMGAAEYGKMIIVTRPVPGEVLATGSRHQIKWDKFGVGSVDILFSSDNGNNWETIADGIADTNSYLWQAPKKTGSNQCVIAVLPGDGDTSVISRESGLFSIRPYPRRPAFPPGWGHWGRLPAPNLEDNKGPMLGCLRWVFDTNGPVVSKVAVTRPDYHGYRIYAGCENGIIYTLSDDGQLLWSYDINSPILGSPAVGYFGMVYVVGQNGKLSAVDDAGNLRWTHTTNGPIYSTPVVGYDGKIYVCSEDGLIYALGADGSELWTFETKGPAELNGAIFATPAVERDGTVYIAGLYDPNLYALDSNNGSVKWVCNFEFPVDPCDPNKGTRAGMPFASPVIGHNGTIYQTLVYDTNLYAIDSNNGDILWRTNLADPCSGWYGADYAARFSGASGLCEPAVGHDGTTYVSLDDPYLRAIRPDGTIKWVTRLGMVGGFTLTVGRDGLIYAASDDGFVCVVNAEGRELSRFKGDGWVSFPVIAEDGTLIVSDANNRVWAIGGRCWRQPPVLHRPQDIEPSWTVDYMDLAVLADSWLECTDPYNWQRSKPGIAKYGTYAPGDINRDLYVDFWDFADLADKWRIDTDLRLGGRSK